MMPVFQTNGTLQGAYPCGDGETTLSYIGVTAAERTAYLQTLTEAGYITSVSEHEIAGNLFNTVYRGNTGLHLSWYPTKGIFKIATETKTYTPVLTEPTVTQTVTPSVTQPGRLGASFDAPGMSYAIQTSDGGFILVDGGPGTETYRADREALLALLKEMAPTGQKPVIHAWFFTHAHGDHMQLACEFLAAYSNEITLELVCANFPDTATMTELVTPAEIEDFEYYPRELARILAAQYPNAQTLKIRAGQAFWLADAYVEILYTHEDYYPEAVEWGNDTSSAFRVTLGGKTTVFLGDCDPKLCQFMADVYGSALKCDILQLSHHGFNGAVLDLYKACDPDICLWPVDSTRFSSDPRCLGTQSGYEFNAYLRDDTIKQRTHYHSSTDTTILLNDQ